MGKKVSFWQFFRKGWDGRALLVRPSKMHHSILFVMGVYKYLSTYLEKAYSFILKHSKITVCSYIPIANLQPTFTSPKNMFFQSRCFYFATIFIQGCYFISEKCDAGCQNSSINWQNKCKAKLF